MNFKNIFLKVCPFLLLLIFVSICYFSQNEKSVTVDEFCHYPSGVYNLLTADWSMDCESPPLIKCLTASTSLITQPNIHLLEIKKMNLTAWSLGYQFMYNNFIGYRNIYKWGRIAVILLGCLLGWFHYRFGRSLFGEAGGIFALFLFVFNPNIIAHSSLTTIDIGTSCFIFLSIYGFWRFLKSQNLFTAILAGVLLGLAQLSKFTALLLYPIYFVILIIFLIARIFKNQGDYKSCPSVKQNIVHFFLILLISLFVINAGYFFSQTFTQLADYHFTSTLLKNVSVKFSGAFPVPLPYYYLIGFDNQLALSEGGVYTSYFMGQHSLSGWWNYYLVAFIIKNPLALLLIIVLTIFFWKKSAGVKLEDSLCIWIPMLMYLIYFSFFTHIPIGIRYILPIFPLFFLAAGSLVNVTSKKWKVAVSIMAGAYMMSALFIYPNYLSYFNVIAGGPKNGHKWLIDSNLDWGQDLPALKKYMMKNGIEEIKLGYFGRVDPHIYGIKYALPNRDLAPGIYAISINYLVGYPYDMLKPNPKELINADLNYFEKYRSLKPVDILNNSIYIFKVSN
jgi:hypothetical protein